MPVVVTPTKNTPSKRRSREAIPRVRLVDEIRSFLLEGTDNQADPLARMSAALADRYTLERQLGAGGMATVSLSSRRPVFNHPPA